MTTFMLPLFLSWIGLQADPTPPVEPKLPGVIMVQETDGIPGRQANGMGRQTLAVTEDRLLMIDHSSNQQFLMRLDESPVGFYEVSTDGREFTRGKDYEKTQTQRDAWEEELRRNRLNKSDAEWRHALEKNFIRVDGERTVEVTPSQAPPVTIEGRSFRVQKYVVTENGRVIVTALVTRDLEVDIPFFEFYRRLGAFSAAVLDELKEIKGVPLEAQITVVTSSFSHKLNSKVIRIGAGELEPSQFELPDRAREVTDSPFVTCRATGRRIERTRAYKHVLTDGTTVWFAEKRDWRDFRKNNGDQIKKGKPGGAGKPGKKPGG